MPTKKLALVETQENVDARMLRETVGNLFADNARLQESLEQVTAMFAREDRGWKHAFTSAGDNGLSLDELKDWSEQIKNSQVGNPHIKRGLMLRSSYVWQGGIKYRGIPAAKQGRSASKNVQALIDSVQNQRNFFGKAARAKREGALYADGLYLVIGDNATKRLHNIPLREITADYRDPNFDSDVWAYRRTWEYFPPGATVAETKNLWYFTDTFADKRVDKLKNAAGEEESVSQTETAFDLIANPVDGFAYGSPDALAALIWSRIARNLYMDGVTMTSAMASFAFKASVANKNAGDGAVLKLGGSTGAGNTAVLGATNDLVPLSSAGKGYDFSSFSPVLSVVATSLDLTVEDLAGDSQASGDKASSLPLPTRLAMEARREEHCAFDKRVLKWMDAPDAEVFFGPLMDPADLYRAQQGVAIKLGTGLYEGVEIKTAFEALEGNDVTNVTIPAGYKQPNNLKTDEAEAKIAAKNAPKPAAASASNGGDMAPTQGSGAKFTGGGSGDQNANDLHSDR